MNGEQTDIVETFRILSEGPGDTVIESERSSRLFGSRISVAARYQSGCLRTFHIVWQNDGVDAVRAARARYKVERHAIRVHRELDGQVFEETVPKPERFAVLPLLRVFAGRVIRAVHTLGAGQPVDVLVPNIRDPRDRVRLLALEPGPRCTSFLGHEALNVDGEDRPAEMFNFVGGSYEQDARFWINGDDMLLKYEWQQGDVLWEVKLAGCDPD